MRGDERVWTMLGIPPSHDPRAIRTAYAVRLKAIDPETEPQAFVQLRWAYEEATRALASDEAPLRYEPSTEPSEAAVLVAPMASADTAERRDTSWERYANAIHALLYGHRGEDPWLNPEERDALIENWRKLVDDPATDRLAMPTELSVGRFKSSLKPRRFPPRS